MSTFESGEALASPWHSESYERFLNDYLPALLAEWGYILPEGNNAGTALPKPDANGVFTLTDETGIRCLVVLPVADSENLAEAVIVCVGERLRDEIRERLGSFPKSARHEAVPLSDWINDFLHHAGQPLDTINVLAAATHRRRLLVEGKITGFHPSHLGRVCPIEAPEGPNHGKVFVVARGALLRDGVLFVADPRPSAGFGLAASLIPFVAHSEPARTLMGANMMRQWQPLPQSEPPLVQTGLEPTPLPLGFWCGVNLRTAFVAWGADTHEDAVVVSESAARRLSGALPLACGDKLSNRHGTKGVVSRIVPDAEMPHRADGTAVEIVYPFFGLPSRMNHGQLLEAVGGRLARVEGRPVVASPYEGPFPADLRARLAAAALPLSGMERLWDGKSGEALERESTVGEVYWGRTIHDAAPKLYAAGDDNDFKGQRIGGDEYRVLRDEGAGHCLYTLTVAQAQSPSSARWEALQDRLAALGIRAQQSEAGLRFDFVPTPESRTVSISLPIAVPHPWRREEPLTLVCTVPDAPETVTARFQAVQNAAERVTRMQKNDAPPRLIAEGNAALRKQVRAYADALLDPSVFAGETRVRKSGRAVIVPGTGLTLEEVGLPEKLAHGLFGTAPGLVERMATSWVLLNRKPTQLPTSFVAFRPRLLEEAEVAVRLHPLLCNWFDADFDGDQMAIFLPDSEAAQREACERLSVRGHLRRHPERLTHPFGGLIPGHAVTFGTALLSQTEAGRRSLTELLGAENLPASGIVDREILTAAIASLLRERGVDAALEALEKVSALAWDVTKASGASMGPFLGENIVLPSAPDDDDGPDAWEAWGDELTEQISALTHDGKEHGADLAPALFAAVSGARGKPSFLAKLIASVAPGVQSDPWGTPLPIRHGWRDGLTPDELLTVVANTRRFLRVLHEDHAASEGGALVGGGVVARAAQTRRPGIVFAQAAASGIIDPLTNPDTRLFVGLPPFV